MQRFARTDIGGGAAPEDARGELGCAATEKWLLIQFRTATSTAVGVRQQESGRTASPTQHAHERCCPCPMRREHATAASPLPAGGLDGAGSSGSSGDDTSTTEAASDADFSPSDSDGGGGGGGGGRVEHAAAMEALFPGPLAAA